MITSLLSAFCRKLFAHRARNGRNGRTPIRSNRRAPRLGTAAVRCRPQLEVLEGRQLLSTFTVVLPTDGGGAAGQKMTATSGDLRYCIAQADASHNARSDTIVFSPKVFATPQTITLNATLGTLTLNDSHPLTIKGPAGGTVTVSGGDQVGVFAVTGGTVALSNLDIIDGHAQSGGGLYLQSGTVTLTNCTLDHDSASGGGLGGGIAISSGTATLINCTLNHDSATNDGSGIANQGTVTLTNCTLSNNAAGGSGGGIDNGGIVTLTDCTLSNNAATLGGGISNLATATLTNCTLSNNTATSGGGIYNGVTVTLTNCTLNNNSASSYGGGIDNGSLNGTVTLTNCTLTNNAARFGGGINNDGTATLTNCTLNHDSGFEGGGIVNLSGTATLTNCTLSNNAAIYYGGGIFAIGSLNLTNTLIAENTASTGPDIGGPVKTADHDLIGNSSGITAITNGSGNLVGSSSTPIDPRLGPLQNNGGPTQTLALLPGSPAIGQADNANAPRTDQRGKLRLDKHGETTDIGAFEL